MILIIVLLEEEEMLLAHSLPRSQFVVAKKVTHSARPYALSYLVRV